MGTKHFIFTGGRTGFKTQPIPYKVYSAEDIVELRGGNISVEDVKNTFGQTCSRWKEVDVSTVGLINFNFNDLPSSDQVINNDYQLHQEYCSNEWNTIRENDRWAFMKGAYFYHELVKRYLTSKNR